MRNQISALASKFYVQIKKASSIFNSENFEPFVYMYLLQQIQRAPKFEIM